MSLLLIIIPMLSAIFLLLARPAGARTLAIVATLANAIVTALAATGYLGDVAFQQSWVPAAGISFSLGMDGISALLIVLTNLLSPLIVLSSSGNRTGLKVAITDWYC